MKWNEAQASSSVHYPKLFFGRRAITESTLRSRNFFHRRLYRYGENAFDVRLDLKRWKMAETTYIQKYTVCLLFSKTTSLYPGRILSLESGDDATRPRCQGLSDTLELFQYVQNDTLLHTFSPGASPTITSCNTVNVKNCIETNGIARC
jgi:hypothetical protein